MALSRSVGTPKPEGQASPGLSFLLRPLLLLGWGSGGGASASHHLLPALSILQSSSNLRASGRPCLLFASLCSVSPVTASPARVNPARHDSNTAAPPAGPHCQGCRPVPPQALPRSPAPAHHCGRHRTLLLGWFQILPSLTVNLQLLSTVCKARQAELNHPTSLPGSLPSPPRVQPLASQRPSQSGLSIADPVTLRHLPGKGPTVRTAVPAPRTKRTDGGLGRREELHVSSVERLRGLSSVVSHVPPPAASGLVVRALLVSIDLQELLIRLLPPLLRAFPLIFPPSHSESPSPHHPQRPAPASNDSHF